MRDSRRRRAGIRNLKVRSGIALDRRRFLAAVLGLLLWKLPRPGRAAALADDTRRALESSGFVYVSPLLGDGSESSCHGELWYGWLDGAVVVIVSSDSWKARAVARGLDRARIWVGDFGRVKGLLWSNEAFREGPHFETRAAAVQDAALLERLLSGYERKYPEEIDRWRERMREGYRDGSRILLRYTPV